MRLYLAQHGEALSADDDPARPLSEAGRQDVAALAKFLEASGLSIARIVHSGKLRAEWTAAILATALAPTAPIESRAGLAPNDSVTEFARQAEDWHEDHLVVGHLPFVDRAVAYLVTGAEAPGVVAFRPGSIVCLERDDDSWRLAWMVRPELLTIGERPGRV
jgi:phosphohistidine phosphatase